MNVALYARVSSEQQAEKDLSIPAQLKALRRYAHERHWEVVNEYIDEAHTGRTDKRPAFQAMIFAARHKECQAILVWKYDRFARNLKIQLLYMEELSSYGIEVISINEPHEDTPLGHFGRANMGAVAQLFSEILAQDVRRGQKENASRGFYNGGPPPFGFAIERISTHGVSRRKLMPDPATAPIVRQIYDLYLSGLGLRKIAHHLNSEHAPAPSPRAWTPEAIHKVLTNEQYAGCVIYGRFPRSKGTRRRATPQKTPNAHEAIVPQAVFDRAQARLRDRRPDMRPPATASSPYLLSGLLTCVRCGARYIVRSSHPNGQRYAYYCCANRWKRGTCDAPHLPLVAIERHVLDCLEQQVLNPAALTDVLTASEQLLAQHTREQERAVHRLTKQIAQQRTRLRRLYEAIETDTVSLDDLAPRIQELRASIDALERQRVASLGPLQGPAPLTAAEVLRQLSQLRALLKSKTPAERQQLARLLIQEVRMDGRAGQTRLAIPGFPSFSVIL